MGKVAVAAASTGVLGTGGTGIYAAHHFGVFGTGKNTKPTKHQDTYIGKTLQEFRQYEGGHCLSYTFQGKWATSEKISKDQPQLGGIGKDVTKLGAKEADQSTIGCLIVNREKVQDQTSKKWEGNFRFVWSLARGKHGFAVYMTGNHKEAKDMQWDGIAYVFENKDGGWRATNKMEIKEGSKKVTEVAKYFPKRNDDSFWNTSGTYNQLWNFIKDSGELDTSTDNANGEEYWHWNESNGSGNQEMKTWSSNMDTWWAHFFDSTNWKMSEVVNGIVGEWGQ